MDSDVWWCWRQDRWFSGKKSGGRKSSPFMPYFHFRWLDEPITDKITTFLTPGEDDVHVFHRLFSPFSPLFCVSENGRYLKTAMLKGKTVTMLITNRVLGVHSDIVLVLVVPDLQIFADKQRSTPIVFGFLCYGAGTDSGGAYRRLGGDPSFGFEHEPCHGTPEMRKPNTKPLFPGSYFISFCWHISTLEV